MMKYTGKYWLVMSLLLKKPLARVCGSSVANRAIKAGKAIYRDLLAKADDIGADNPMASNLYLCLVLMAIWEAADGAISVDELRQAVNDLMSSPMAQKHLGGANLNNPNELAAFKERLHRNRQWALDHPQYLDATWDFNFDEEKHRDGVYYHYTRCPIEKFARDNGYLDVLAIGCDLDHTMARMRHAVLHRDQTLASGGCMCDYWIVPDEINNPR